MPKALEKKLRVVRFRCSFNLLVEQTGRILATAGIIAVLGVLIERLLALSIVNSWTLWSFSSVVIALIIWLWAFNQPSRMQVSLLLDERLRLHERFSTTLAMAQSEDPFARAACAEARQVAQRISPKGHFPIKASKCWLYAAGTWVIVGILVSFMPQKDLLGFLKKQQQQQQQARQVESAQRDIEQTTSTAAATLVIAAILAARLLAISFNTLGRSAREACSARRRRISDSSGCFCFHLSASNSTLPESTARHINSSSHFSSFFFSFIIQPRQSRCAASARRFSFLPFAVCRLSPAWTIPRPRRSFRTSFRRRTAGISIPCPKPAVDRLLL